MDTAKRTDLQQLRSSGVVREQIHGPLDDVTTGAPPLEVLGLLAFAENLDGGKSSDLKSTRWILIEGFSTEEAQ